MKRIFMFLSVLFLVVPFAVAEASWQDETLPPEDIKDADVLYKINPDVNNIVYVGVDIPAGLYGIAPFKFENSPIIDFDYIFAIMRGTETIFQSDLLNTKTHSDLIVNLDVGDVLIIASNGNITYLHSVDTVMLRPY